MARGFHGRLWPESEDQPLWSDSPHPGMVLRRVTLDASGNVVREVVTEIPLDRSLESAMAWAAKEYS